MCGTSDSSFSSTYSRLIAYCRPIAYGLFMNSSKSGILTKKACRVYARVRHSVSSGDGSLDFLVDVLNVSCTTVGTPLSILRK